MKNYESRGSECDDRHKNTMTAIAISRGTIIQDLLVKHRVLIDGQERGRLRAHQAGIYPVEAGVHRVQLRIGNSASSSDELSVDVRPGETRTLRTVSRGIGSYLPDKSRPLAWPLPIGMYRRPWIILRLDDRNA